ncbi:MAG: ribosomal RNA small subunit methyltransferase A [Planctomycetales bacterium]|nr:ribosomal RNA small subunit methyltransferase A [Planctomycetales bacterium]
MTQPRQTMSFLMRRFDEAGIHPVTRHGQNFLIDLNLVELLVQSAELGPQDVVLEIGTGTGSLTAMMAAQAAAVVTVELDANLHQLAREELVDFDNITMLRQDALRNKNNFDPAIMQAVRAAIEAGPDRRLKLAANLPYNIATPVISNLMLTEIVPVSMTVTIQKEVAERIVARPGTKDYGALSIWLQSQCETEIVRIMPPSVFWPRPKVESAIVRITLNPEKRAQIGDLTGFHEFVRSMFFHRRKFLRSELLSAYKKRLAKPDVDAVLETLNLSGELRAEQLDVPTMLRLYETAEQRLSELG